MAAAAIKERIVSLNRPLVFLPVLPLKKGSVIESVMVDDAREVVAEVVDSGSQL